MDQLNSYVMLVGQVRKLGAFSINGLDPNPGWLCRFETTQPSIRLVNFSLDRQGSCHGEKRGGRRPPTKKKAP